VRRVCASSASTLPLPVVGRFRRWRGCSLADLLSKRRINLTVASFAAAAVVLAGCGSSGSQNSSRAASTVAPATASPSRASYVGQVDAICRAASGNQGLIATTRAIERLNSTRLSAAEAASKLAPLWERESAQQRAYNEQIAAVAQPSGDRARLGELASAREALTTTDQSIAAMLRNNPEAAAYERLGKQLAERETRLSALDRKYGFKSCGVGIGRE
jgi:hypothetical protein